MRESRVLVVLLLVIPGTVTGGKEQIVCVAMGYYLEEGMSQHLYLFTVEPKLNLTVGSVTCSSVTVSWTTVDNRTADITIFYNSTVHSGNVDYMRDASPPHTTMLPDLVADTEYTITVTATYSANTTTSGTVTANTSSGTTSDQGMYVWYIDMVYLRTIHTPI